MVEGSSTRRSFPARVLPLALIVCAVMAGGLMLSGAQALAATGEPVISGVSVTNVTEHGVTIEAQINSEGSETAYEIRLVWQVADPKGGPPNGGEGELPTGGPQTQTGNIAAGSGDQTVSATLALQWGYTYYYVIAAISSAGKTKGESPYSIPFHISGEFPNGSGTGPPYESEIPLWSTRLAESESAQTVREYEAKQQQKAKEQEEFKAREAVRLAAEAAEIKRIVEEKTAAEAAARAAVRPRCVVPSLMGDTLSKAQRALSKAHCKLGKITEPRTGRGALVVVGQGVEHGKQLPDGAAVAVKLARPVRRR